MCSRLTCKADSTHKFIAMIAKRVLNIFVTKKKLYPSSKKIQIVGQYSQGTHPGLVLQYWTIARKVFFFLILCYCKPEIWPFGYKISSFPKTYPFVWNLVKISLWVLHTMKVGQNHSDISHWRLLWGHNLSVFLLSLSCYFLETGCTMVYLTVKIVFFNNKELTR